MVVELAEVLLAQPVERGAVELRRPADEVVDAGWKGFPFASYQVSGET